MSLNNIELPAAVLADLYKSSLIGEASSKSVSKEQVQLLENIAPKETKNKYLGNNRQNILIIVRHNDVVHLPDGELQFLTGILTACKRSMEDVVIINLNNYPGNIQKELTATYKSKVVLLFDTEPASFGLPMSFPHYQLQAFGGSTYLYAPSLQQLENDKLEKSKLWVCLKRLFNL